MEFYIDGIKKATFYNNGQDWFPLQKMHVIVSQQILYPAGGYTPLTPQTSYFDWVKVTQYFKPPTITLTSNVICTNGSATLDVDSEATNIGWCLSPTSFFSGTTSNSGENASFNIASGASGEATITYTFEMPGGESFNVEKSFWVGEPDNSQIDMAVMFSNFPHTELCINEEQAILARATGDTDQGITKFNWEVGGWTSYFNGYTYSPGGITNSSPSFILNNNAPTPQIILVSAENKCGSDPAYFGQGKMFSTKNCYSFYLVMTPNPTSGETSLSIEKESIIDSTSKIVSTEQDLDKNAEWDLEIYNHTQNLKLKKDKLKGKSTRINTSGWKHGVYLVRVKYKDQIILGKLIVQEQ